MPSDTQLFGPAALLGAMVLAGLLDLFRRGLAKRTSRKRGEENRV